MDIFDVAVRLETSGVTDRVAREDYDCRDVLELAEICFPALNDLAPVRARPAPPSAIAEYIRGVSFAFPLLLCSLAMLIFRFSLWGGDVSAEVAAVTGVGTISSFIVTGGFVQGLSRRCLFLLNASEARGVRPMCLGWVLWALGALALSGAALGGASVYFRWFPLPLIGLLAGFHFALGLLWISAGLLEVFERSSQVLSACSIGLVTVLGCHFGAKIPVMGSQIVGILTAAAFAFHSAWRAMKEHPLAAAAIDEPLAMDLYVTWRFFAFGALYYLFLFADRLLAWTVPDWSASLAIVFRGDYETGLDISLIAFVLAAGLVRPLAVFFFHRLKLSAQTTRIADRQEFRHKMQTYYGCQLLVLAVAGFGISVTVGILAHALMRSSGGRITQIMALSLAAVPCLVVGLWNSNLQFRLARPGDPLIALIPAVLVDLISGYLMSRLGGYALAAAGLALGSLTFAVISWLVTRNRLQHLDFENYGSAI